MLKRQISRLQLLAVGAGRDGTVSLTEIINRIYALNGIVATAAHEYASRDVYRNYCAFRETGKHKYLGFIEDSIRDCPVEAVVGNGYAFVLDVFARASQGRIRLIHLRRRDREACLRSLVENARLYPEAYRYYADDPRALVPRAAAFHLGDMTREQWDALSLEARKAWYFDATHRLIETGRHLFVNSMSIATEDLSTPDGLARLTEFVLGRPGEVPEPVHLNRHVPLDFTDLPADQRLSLHFLFNNLDLARSARENSYLLHHVAARFLDWWRYRNANRAEFPAENDASLARELDLAEHALSACLASVRAEKECLAGVARDIGGRNRAARR